MDEHMEDTEVSTDCLARVSMLFSKLEDMEASMLNIPWS
jgi:hypothetical protein